jgi:hypothetical protein
MRSDRMVLPSGTANSAMQASGVLALKGVTILKDWKILADLHAYFPAQKLPELRESSALVFVVGPHVA